MPGDVVDIHWPLAGLSRRMGFQQTEPYTTYDCLNVRNQDVFQQRLRGGSRPGLVQVLPPKSFEIGDEPASGTFGPVYFTPLKDLEIEGHASTDDANWNNNNFNVGNDSALTDPLRALLHFNLSSIPTGATITIATLELYNTTTSAAGVACSVYRLLSIAEGGHTDWGETTCTWNKYDGTNAWTTPGGDYHATSPTPVTWNLFTATGWQYITGLAAMAQDAYDNRSDQLHIILRQDTENATIRQNQFRSIQYIDSAFWPRLAVTYTI